MKTVRNVLAIVLILYGLFGSGILDLLDKPIKPEPKPEPPNVSILNIDKPSDVVLAKVKDIAKMITDPTDKAKLAIFNYQFATNVVSYDTNLQQVNDVYVLAGKNFFKDSIVGKYKDLASKLIALVQDSTGPENHTLSEQEKQAINENFMGLAWALIQKDL